MLNCVALIVLFIPSHTTAAARGQPVVGARVAASAALSTPPRSCSRDAAAQRRCALTTS